MNKDIITQVLQEILQADPNYFLPKQLHVLSWKSKRIAGALITKINGQRYLGLPSKDSQGQDYWRYKLLPNPDSSGETKFDEQQTKFRSNQSSTNNSLDSVAKFQARQAKTQEINHDQANSEPAVNQQSN